MCIIEFVMFLIYNGGILFWFINKVYLKNIYFVSIFVDNYGNVIVVFGLKIMIIDLSLEYVFEIDIDI